MAKNGSDSNSTSVYLSSTISKVETSNVSTIFIFTKRIIDILGAFIGLIVTFPIFLIVSSIYLFGESRGPLLFKQQRFGKNGKMFSIYKFRSMIVNADEKLKQNKELYNKYVQNSYKLEQEEDPRITKIGMFLRKTSLDELPQLINVLKGEMSLIGPRPIVEEEIEEYKDKKDHFLSVKPGLTGYWQVKGRSEIGYPERVDLELYYIYNQSLKLDLYIFFKTFMIVLLKKGAY